MVKYYYEGYGKLIHIEDASGINLSNINPFRYKSYYYDSETGWYYLNSRYYDPIASRFVTMDQVEYFGASGTIHSLNLFTYCEGNPVVRIDSQGNFWEKIKQAIAFVAIVILIVIVKIVVKVVKKAIEKQKEKEILKEQNKINNEGKNKQIEYEEPSKWENIVRIIKEGPDIEYNYGSSDIETSSDFPYDDLSEPVQDISNCMGGDFSYKAMYDEKYWYLETGVLW